jgi:prepilin-type N-terminal cleavage/methylation domain-containing protein
MPMSGICRLNRTAGFTLLELLIVLALFALVAGVVAPRLNTVYDRVRWASERDDVLEKIAGLGFKALKEGRTFEFPSSPPKEETSVSSAAADSAFIKLPEGWSVTAEFPIRYRDNGVCEGGRLTLQCEDQILEVVLRPPLCRPEIIQ